jgi:hypothetical protein
MSTRISVDVDRAALIAAAQQNQQAGRQVFVQQTARRNVAVAAEERRRAGVVADVETNVPVAPPEFIRTRRAAPRVTPRPAANRFGEGGIIIYATQSGGNALVNVTEGYTVAPILYDYRYLNPGSGFDFPNPPLPDVGSVLPNYSIELYEDAIEAIPGPFGEPAFSSLPALASDLFLFGAGPFTLEGWCPAMKLRALISDSYTFEERFNSDPSVQSGLVRLTFNSINFDDIYMQAAASGAAGFADFVESFERKTGRVIQDGSYTVEDPETGGSLGPFDAFWGYVDWYATALTRQTSTVAPDQREGWSHLVIQRDALGHVKVGVNGVFLNWETTLEQNPETFLWNGDSGTFFEQSTYAAFGPYPDRPAVIDFAPLAEFPEDLGRGVLEVLNQSGQIRVTPGRARYPGLIYQMPTKPYKSVPPYVAPGSSP